MRVAVLVSGTGSILEALMAAEVPVALVLADRPCLGLGKAETAGVPTVLVERDAYDARFDREAYSARVVEALDDHRIDLVLMAGYGTILGQAAHDAYGGRIINTHPALLPAFKGWHAVRDALAAGVEVTGCTVHVAGLEVDTGPILAQEEVPVLPGDDEASLHERIKAVERRLFPDTVKAILARGSVLPPDGAAPPGRGDRPRSPCLGGLVRALLSVYDKSGVVDLARGLAEAGWDLVSSGGTAAAIAAEGIAVTDVADLTGAPAILGHRVMTLHPKVHGGLLADRDDPEHLADMEAHGIEGIDLLVANLYPFGADPTTFTHGGRAGAIDLIDIGGPAMIRAAAKNHAFVAVVVDPADYGPVLAEVQADGALGAATRHRLAAKAFATTSAYDGAIADWFARSSPLPGAEGAGATDGPAAAEATEVDPLPAHLRISAAREPITLRYGENPHQRAALYRTDGADPWWAHLTQHSGVALSYLNLYDADAAWLLAHDLAEASGQVACAIIKHANPCGAAVAATPAEAYRLAFDCDPRSAFGGIVALSVPIDEPTVEAMVAAAQADVVIAPAYGDGVLDALRAKRKNTRLLEAPTPTPDALHVRPVTGGYLVQEPHRFVADPSTWRVVTERQPTEAERADAALAFRLCGWVTSNSIVLVRDGVAWGIGAGQQNRVEAGQIATAKAAGRAAGGACASDAFYPFPDGIEAAAEAGVAVVVQPGGSVRDAEVIAKADDLGLAMLFTGERHFLH